MSYPQLEGYAVPAAQSGVSERLAFIRKVYSLMFVGVLFFFASAALPLLGAAAGNATAIAIVNLAFMIPWWMALLLLIGTAFIAGKVQDIPGVNLIGFFAISGLFGFLSISLIAVAASIGGAMILVQALALTCAVMGGLSAYVFITRKDFSFMKGFLTIGLVLGFGAILLGFVLSMMGMDVNVFQIGLAMFFCILFSGYVLYDTSNVLHHYSTSMVVPAATALMIDFVILFRQILILLMASRD